MLQEGQQIENVLWFVKDTNWLTADLTDLATSAITAWNTSIAPVTAANVTLVKVVATNMEVETGPSVEIPAVGAIGTRTGTPAPNGVSFKLKVTTEFAGRNFTGGPYHIGIVNDDVEGSTHNSLKPTPAADIRAGWADFVDDAPGSTGAILAVASFCHDNTWRTVAVVTPYLNISYTDLWLDRQWRRMPPRGR